MSLFTSASTPPDRDPRDVAAALEVRRRHTELHLSALRRFKFRQIPAESDRYATFVEVRRSPYAEFALRNVMYFLGDGWGLQIFVTPEAKDWVAGALDGWRQVHINVIDPENFKTGVDLLNARLRESSFWRAVRGKWQLMFNSDSMLCRGGVERFLKFDYVGAPWPESTVSPWCRVGSGGTSLRRRRSMLELCETCNNNPWIIGREDVFFSLVAHMDPVKYALPDVPTAMEFCVEHIYHPAPLSMYRPWLHINAIRLQRLYSAVDYSGIK